MTSLYFTRFTNAVLHDTGSELNKLFTCEQLPISMISDCWWNLSECGMPSFLFGLNVLY